jgi:hypothetical protein
LNKASYKPEQQLRLEQLLEEQTAVAYCMMIDGTVYTAVFERYEREIAAIRDRDDAMSRALRLLEGDVPAARLKAIA